jgi:nucleotide-binding universal stress UspA family protein
MKRRETAAPAGASFELERAMFQRLLVAIDDSPSSPVALSYTCALARAAGGSVHVLHVNPFQVGGRGFTELTETEATELVDDAVGQLRDQGIDATGSVARATCYSLGQIIADAAQIRQSDVIVVGSRRRTRVRRLFGRGAREQITRCSTLPVLTAPAPLDVPVGHRGRPGSAGMPSRHRPTPAVH